MASIRLFTALSVACALNGISGQALAADAAGPGVINHGDWYAYLGAIVLTRSRPASGIVVAANPAGTSFSDASDFSFGSQPGWDVAFGLNLPNGRDGVGFRFFNANDINAKNNFVTPGNFIGAGFTGPGGTSFTGNYNTDLFSGEVNWQHKFADAFTALVGFRYLSVNDDMSYKINGNVATGDYVYNNNLYGAQIGADVALLNPTHPLQINVGGKVGVFANATDGGIFEYQGNNFIGSFVGQDTSAAYLAEATVSARFRLTEHLAFLAGYQATWLSGIGLGATAASVSLLNPSLLRTVRRGDVLFQGFTVGVKATW